jgi:hypothetical protein
MDDWMLFVLAPQLELCQLELCQLMAPHYHHHVEPLPVFLCSRLLVSALNYASFALIVRGRVQSYPVAVFPSAPDLYAATLHAPQLLPPKSHRKGEARLLLLNLPGPQSTSSGSGGKMTNSARSEHFGID